MTFDKLITQTGHLPFFDLSLLVQISGEEKAQIGTQIHRWIQSGKIVPLRRQMYTFADRYRKVPFSTATLANELYKPSYLSGIWCLSYLGLIPESVHVYTGVTPRVPRTFSNAFGTFQYSNIKQANFFGYRAVRINGQRAWFAEPEKALLDYWHLNKDEWSLDRITEMRFQNFDLVDCEKLKAYAERFHSPRLVRAVINWECLIVGET